MAQASYIDLTSARVATIVRWRCLSQSASPFAARLGPRDFPASILQALHICAVFCAMAPRRTKTTRTQTHANHLILSLCASITDTWSPNNFPFHKRVKFFTLSVFRFSIELLKEKNAFIWNSKNTDCGQHSSYANVWNHHYWLFFNTLKK
jgi:hypothetical protein